jgi:response regulator RpfG family c-di-GMP phosphodiesterase
VESVLLVDDENGIRGLMTRWIESIGYESREAANAEEALDHMSRKVSEVAVCDIRLPGRDGLWLAEQIRQQYPDTAVIMATGVHDVDAAVTSLRSGVVDYLVKPFGRDRLREALVRGFGFHQNSVDARKWRQALEAELGARRQQLSDALAEVEITSQSALNAILAMLTVRDRPAYDHARRVAVIAVHLARALGMTVLEVADVERAALLHDIGKIAIPEAVLLKPASLTDEEREIMRRQPQLGHDLLARMPFLAEAAEIVVATQERFDGTGYPRGLSGDRIPLGSRIVSVADAYDAMTHARAHRDAVASSEAVSELQRSSGSQFDPRVVNAMIHYVNQALGSLS